MARAGILYSQVARAAAALATAGTKPTVDTVRAALGGTGSKSTIAPMLKQWKAEHEGQVTAAGTGLPADLLEVVKAVHQRLEAAAQVQVDELRAALEQASKEAAQQLEAERAAGRQLRAEREALADELAQMKAALAIERDERQHADVTNAALRAKSDGLTQRLADRAADVTLLTDQLAQGRRQFEHFQEKAAQQRQSDRQGADARIAGLERELGTARGYLQEHREALAILRGEKAHLEDKVAELNEAGKAQARQLREITDALGAARELASARQLGMEMVKQRLKSVEHENVQLDTRNRDLLDKVATLKAQQEAPPGPAGTRTTRNRK